MCRDKHAPRLSRGSVEPRVDAWDRPAPVARSTSCPCRTRHILITAEVETLSCLDHFLGFTSHLIRLCHRFSTVVLATISCHKSLACPPVKSQRKHSPRPLGNAPRSLFCTASAPATPMCLTIDREQPLDALSGKSSRCQMPTTTPRAC